MLSLRPPQSCFTFQHLMQGCPLGAVAHATQLRLDSLHCCPKLKAVHHRTAQHSTAQESRSQQLTGIMRSLNSCSTAARSWASMAAWWKATPDNTACCSCLLTMLVAVWWRRSRCLPSLMKALGRAVLIRCTAVSATPFRELHTHAALLELLTHMCCLGRSSKAVILCQYSSTQQVSPSAQPEMTGHRLRLGKGAMVDFHILPRQA